MSKARRIKLTADKARQLKRLLNMQLRGFGSCTITPTAGGWDITVNVPRRGEDASAEQAPGRGTIVAEHDNYLLLRPIDAAFDDASRDFPVRKPRDLRVSTWKDKMIQDRDGGVDVATQIDFYTRRLTSILDDADYEDQVIIPPYLPARTINVDDVPTNFVGSTIEYGVASSQDDPILDDSGNEMPAMAYEDLNRWQPRAWGEDNGS